MKLASIGGRGRFFPGTVLAVVFCLGCARQPQVRSEALPVKKVVVYRNGVAYFERGGEVSDPAVQFQLREENVGDFLATLAIMEKGGHTVHSASFPVVLDEDEEEQDPELERALQSWEREKADPRRLREVTLQLDGESHDLTVGYLAETPLWRPSYRLVVGDDGQASLQVWGIVQNQSGEDWENVELALVAGAPIAFESTLGRPVVPPRPVVTDEGEVIQSVPQAGATYHQEKAPAEPMADMDGADAAEMEDEASMGSSRAAGGAGVARAKRRASADEEVREEKAMMAPAAAPAPSMNMVDLSARSMEGLAQVEVQSGATRYEVPFPVTIPDQSATMVLLVSKRVPGQAVHLYAPDPGVFDSERHPFRVARFKNESGGLLEKGPIAVFEEGAFLGQGMLKSLPVKAEATVPFALVRDVAVERSVRHDQRDVHFYAVRRGVLFIERDQATLTTYHLQNGDQEAVKLLVKHPRTYDSKLHDPPQGTEDVVAERVAYVPAQIPKFGKTDLVVEERRPAQAQVAWESVDARTAMKQALALDWISSEQKAVLTEILSFAEKLAAVTDDQDKRRREQAELEKSARETRLSLSSIEKNPSAAGLRKELTDRLAETTRRLDEITKELVELGLKQSEFEVRLKRARENLEIPPQKSGKGESGEKNLAF